jgi:citronellol/citronellal dehydrogenase
MGVYAMAMAREFRQDRIAFHTLWPRTTIATAALRKLPDGDALAGRSRTPEIMADAAHAILTKDSGTFTGQQCIDDRVLAAEGITDLRPYRVLPGSADLETDLFVPASMPAPAGIRV